MNWLAAASAVGVGLACVAFPATLATAIGLSFSYEPGLRWLLVPLFALIGVLGVGLAVGAS